MPPKCLSTDRRTAEKIVRFFIFSKTAKQIYTGFYVLLLSCLSAAPAAPSETSRERLEQDARDTLRSTEASTPLARAQKLFFDYGGWLNFRYIDYHNDDKDSSTADEINHSFWQDSRLWAKLIYDPDPPASQGPVYSFYVRFKNLYTDSRPKETAGGSDNDGPHIDYAYGTFDLRPLSIKAGKFYFDLGQGIALGDVADGAEFTYNFSRARLKTFFAQSRIRQHDIDTSIPGFDKKSKRYFYGLEYSTSPLKEQNAYSYLLIQRDKTGEEPVDPGHSFSYDSQYLGLGVRGRLFERVSYWWEGVGETGTSFIYDTNEKKDILAWASVFALSYDPDIYTHPSFYFKYAYGSGDKDRASVTNTVDGNSEGRDSNFLYFGFLPTGYALAPQLSNLYFFKTGFGFTPFEENKFLKDVSCAFDYYIYRKAKRGGGIDDEQATESSSDIGKELDLTLSWQALSDLSFSLEYGHFWPGKAYALETRSNENYFSLSTTFVF